MTLPKLIGVVCAALVLCSVAYSEVVREQAAKDWVSMEKLLDEWSTFFFQNEFEKSPEEFEPPNAIED